MHMFPTGNDCECQNAQQYTMQASWLISDSVQIQCNFLSSEWNLCESQSALECWDAVFLAQTGISLVGLKGHEYVTIAFSGGISTNVYKLFMVSFSYYCRLSQLRIMFKVQYALSVSFLYIFFIWVMKNEKIKTWKQTPYHSILFHIFRQLVDLALYYRTHSGSIKKFSGSKNFYCLKRLKRKLSMAFYERKCWRGNGNICQEVRKIYKTRIQSKCEKA